MSLKSWIVGFVALIAFFQSANAGFSYEKELILVKHQVDSLASIYGRSSPKQEEVFITSITNLSKEIYEGNELDHSVQYEAYLEKIAKKLDPTFNKKVYLFKSPYANAFTIFNGDVFFHWALIADAENESSIAFTMGHELGHSKGVHIYKSFLNEQKSSTVNHDEEIKKWHYEQDQEYYCDSIGFELATAAGYNWKSGMANFYEYLSLDTIFNYLSKRANVFNGDGELINDVFYDESSDTLFSSHPPTASRIKLRMNMGRKVRLQGKNSLVNAVTFKSLQTYAREQVLQGLLENRDYKLGVIKAFKYYSLDPTNKKFKYFLLEFLRRKYLQSGAVMSRGLFADIFKLSKDKSIHDNLRWVFRNKSELKAAKKNIATLLGKNGTKYKDLIDHIENSENKEYAEYYLSMALFHHKDETKKTYFINQYLKQKNKSFEAFGIAFKNDELSYQLRGNNKNIFLYQVPTFMLRTKEGTREEVDKGKSMKGDKMKRFIEHLGKKGEFEFFNVQGAQKSQQGTFIGNVIIPYLYSKVYSEEMSGGLMISGSSTAYLVAPELWTYFYQNKVKTIYLVNNYAYKDKTVGVFKDFFVHLVSVKEDVKMSTESYYYGKSRNSYSYNLLKFSAADFSVSEKSEFVKARLSKNALKTELKLSIK